jgi:hypothetical protein
MISKLKVICVSDVHLGHHRTKTEFIVNNLKKCFFDTGVMEDADLFLIAGDFFDRLLSLPVEEVRLINDWIVSFLARCKRHNVMVRVLEGTPSHDWKQSRLFDEMNRHLGDAADLKYVDTLSVEYIPRLDASILYVPDEWSEEADETWKQVSDMLRGMGLEKVDFACMHGVFQYQLPISSPICHNEERYLSIVREAIFIGHHHLHTRYDRIFAEGSFDRLSHGEEKPKGFGIYRRDGDSVSLEFVENPYAKIYKTLNLVGMGVEEAIKVIEPYRDYPAGSHFRLLTRRSDGVSSAMNKIRDLFPGFYWTPQLEDLETNETSLQSAEKEDIPKPIAITRDNIGRLIAGRLPDLDPRVEKALHGILERVA